MTDQLSDRAIATALKAHLEYWLRGTLDDLAEVAEWVLEAHQTRFPYQVALLHLAKEPTRRLYRALDDETLQDLYDLASDAGMAEQADALARAIMARPYVDDGRVPRAVREAVMKRDGSRCQACGRTDNLTIDHKYIPWSDGGSSTDPANLQVLCRSCNSRKGRRPWLDGEDR